MSTKRDRVWEAMQTAQVEVTRYAAMLGQTDFEKDPERFAELLKAHTLAIENRRVAEAAWYDLIKKARK